MSWIMFDMTHEDPGVTKILNYELALVIMKVIGDVEETHFTQQTWPG